MAAVIAAKLRAFRGRPKIEPGSVREELRHNLAVRLRTIRKAFLARPFEPAVLRSTLAAIREQHIAAMNALESCTPPT